MRQRIELLACGVVCFASGAKAEDSNADWLFSERLGLTTSGCITASGLLQSETALPIGRSRVVIASAPTPS